MNFIDFLWEYRIRTAIAIYIIFLIIYTILAIFNLIPTSFEAKPQVPESTLVIATSTSPVTTQAISHTPPPIIKAIPIRIVIESIGVDAKISNPTSQSIAVLDEYLRQGAVRYPGSADLGAGNVFLFGHSTGLRVVNNQAYKTFNNFKLLKGGEVVRVYSLDKEYTYTVEKIRLADAEEVFVDFSVKKNMLTLSTCNTFGQKEERYVVEAVFSSVKPIVTETV